MDRFLNVADSSFFGSITHTDIDHCYPSSYNNEGRHKKGHMKRLEK